MENNNKKYGLHITHNDADAVGCALVAAYYRQDLNFEDSTFFCPVGKADEALWEFLDNIHDENYPSLIIISDISISEESCRRLEELANKYKIVLYGCDHHPTNNLEKDFPWFYVQKTKEGIFHPDGKLYEAAVSAAWVLNERIKDFKYLSHDNSHVSKIIDTISRYDTWEWRHNPSQTGNEDLVAAICSTLGPQKMFLELLDHVRSSGNLCATDRVFPEYFYMLYETNSLAKERAKEKVLSKTRLITTDDGYNVALFICGDTFGSACAEVLYNTYDELDIVGIIYPDISTLSLRTKKADIHVGMLAKNWGGGGHAAAAGVKLNDEQMLNLFKLFYSASMFVAEE